MGTQEIIAKCTHIAIVISTVPASRTVIPEHQTQPTDVKSVQNDGTHSIYRPRGASRSSATDGTAPVPQVGGAGWEANLDTLVQCMLSMQQQQNELAEAVQRLAPPVAPASTTPTNLPPTPGVAVADASTLPGPSTGSSAPSSTTVSAGLLVPGVPATVASQTPPATSAPTGTGESAPSPSHTRTSMQL